MAFVEPKLVLHLDINLTITPIDRSRKIGLDEGVNTILSKVAFLKFSPGTLCWHDGSPYDLHERLSHNLDHPPPLYRCVSTVSTSARNATCVRFVGAVPDGCISYYDLFGPESAAKFTNEGPGLIYSAFKEELMHILTWPRACKPADGLVLHEHGRNYHSIVPSFFNLLAHLSAEQPPPVLVLRTMGKDMELVRQALESFAKGMHPVYKPERACPTLRCCDSLHWRMERGGEAGPGGFVLRSGRAGIKDVIGEDAIARFLSSAGCCVGVEDDWAHWTRQGLACDAGKPFWFTQGDRGVHPIMLDGNVTMAPRTGRDRLPSDLAVAGPGVGSGGPGKDGAARGVVHVRARREDGQPFLAPGPAEIATLVNVLLVQVDLVQAILDPDYFVDALHLCRDNLARLRASPDLLACLQSAPPPAVQPGRPAAVRRTLG